MKYHFFRNTNYFTANHLFYSHLLFSEMRFVEIVMIDSFVKYGNDTKDNYSFDDQVTDN